MTKHPRFKASEDVEACADYLRAKKTSGIITFEQLETATGRDIRGKDRYILTSARRILEHEALVFVSITGRGVARASDAEVATLSTNVPIEKTRRIARTAKKRQRNVNIQNLTDEQRAAFWIGSAVLGAINQAASRALRDKMREEVNVTDGAIPLSKTLELFGAMKSSNDTPH